jgi:CelD/BcsL family acetyltransferase involved in cellulose biosynthesis
MNTFDATYAKLSPCTVLIDYCVKWAFDNRLDFDFGYGVQQYKHYWSQGTSYDNVTLRLAQTHWGFVGCTMKVKLSRACKRVGQMRSGEVEARLH